MSELKKFQDKYFHYIVRDNMWSFKFNQYKDHTASLQMGMDLEKIIATHKVVPKDMPEVGRKDLEWVVFYLEHQQPWAKPAIRVLNRLSKALSDLKGGE